MRTVQTARGIQSLAIQGRALPHLLCVWSMIYPMTRSEIPSNIFDMAMIEAAAAAFAPTTLV